MSGIHKFVFDSVDEPLKHLLENIVLKEINLIFIFTLLNLGVATFTGDQFIRATKYFFV